MRFFASISNKFDWRMGCVNSRTDTNDRHPNVFQVENVDDLGNLVTPGRLEINESDIILYQKNKPPVKWPLRCLRRYGYDAEIFSFESGRRCSTGPGIYAFKCRRAAQLFNLVQTNIQQVCTNGDDTISREMPISTHSGPNIVTRVTIPTESNYLDPTPARSNERIVPTLPYNHQNGRLNSIGSSSGPMSPQGTMGSPSPPPVLPLSLPPPPPVPQFHPSSLYVNEEAIQSTVATDLEHNNNKSLTRQSMQRSHTVSSTSSSGFLSFEQTSSQVMNNSETWSSSHNRIAVPPQLPAPSYMNVDLGSDASPLSPSHSTAFETSTPVKEDPNDALDGSRTYMNISPGQEKLELVLPVIKTRPPALSIQPLHSEPEEGARHCYANLDASEIEGLKKRFSATFIGDKLPLQSQTPPPLGVREVSYAVLDLDKKDTPPATGAASSTDEQPPSQLPTPSSPPDSPAKGPKIGYVTIDFNKTAALSHSVNSSLVNDIDEGCRKTRHNSTISELIASPSTRHNSSMSE